MVEALKKQIAKTHRHHPHLLGKLLTFVYDIRTITHVFDYNQQRRLTEFEEILPNLNPRIKDSMSSDGKVYGFVSKEVVKYICDGVSTSNKSKTRLTRNRKIQPKRLAEKSKPLCNFQFFKPP